MLFPFYKGYDAVDCGPTSLRMVAKHYGKNISLQTQTVAAVIQEMLIGENDLVPV